MKLFWNRLRLAFRNWQADKAPRLGASLAYYAIFSLAPLLVVLVGALGLIIQSRSLQTHIVSQADQTFGTGGGQLIGQLLLHVSRPSGNVLAIVIGGIATLLGAIGIFGQLRDALDTIWHSQERSGLRATAAQYGISFILLAIIAILLLGSLAVSAGLTALSRHLPYVPVDAWHLIDLIASIAITGLLFALVFRESSSHRPSWHAIWPAAWLTSALFTAGKFLLGIYLGRGSIGSAYGAAGSLAVILVWLYYSAQILLFGAEYLKTLEAPHPKLPKFSIKSTPRTRLASSLLLLGGTWLLRSRLKRR